MSVATLVVIIVAAFIAIVGFGIVYLAGVVDTLDSEVETLADRLRRLESQVGKKPGNVSSRECARAKAQ